MTDPLVPTFIIGGAPRSGTSALAHALDRHPGVAMAKPFVPEPKVFVGPPADGGHLERYREFFRPEDADLARGEKTANYFESEPARRAIAAELPEVLMLFLLREPVARAYSNWLWSRKNGFETLPFAEAVATEEQRPDPLPETPHVRPFDYLARSAYADLARGWYEDLNRDRVAFFLFEDMLGDPAPATLTRIQELIGVSPDPALAELPTGIGNEAADAGPPIDAGLERGLRERARPQVEGFAELSGLDVGPWGYG